MGLRKVYLGPNEVPIYTARLAELLVKERAHDGYVRAIQAMDIELLRHKDLFRVTHSPNEKTYHLGWLDGIRKFDTIVLQAIERQVTAHPDVDLMRLPPVRKGQVCLVSEPGCHCLVSVREPAR